MTEGRLVPRRCLVANRGEIAVRIIRGCQEAGVQTVAVTTEDEPPGPHLDLADEVHGVPGRGTPAYVDIDSLLAAARRTKCDALHPGYGFASEDARLAEACVEHGVRFVGPDPATLALWGDKDRARRFAAEAGVPVLPGTSAGADPTEIEALWDSLPSGSAVMLKATDGGGGRGLRMVTERAQLVDALARCRSEVGAGGSVFAEQRLTGARHIEVQLIGDGTAVTHLGDRECSVQRRHQKLIELCPAWDLPDALRSAIVESALRLGRAAPLRSLLTLEFLVEPRSGSHYFLEGNPRIQVEHTVTEEVTGLDLVGLQLRLSMGATLEDLGLTEPPPLRGAAAQARINLEAMDAEGHLRPGRGQLTAYRPPRGPGVRVDDGARLGVGPDPRFDSILAKIIVHVRAGAIPEALAKLDRALAELTLEGVESNRGLLRAILGHPQLDPSHLNTAFVDEHRTSLWNEARRLDPPTALALPDPEAPPDHGPGVAVRAPLRATVTAVEVRPDQVLPTGQTLMVLEAMKMEHVIRAPSAGTVLQLAVAPGDVVSDGEVLLRLRPDETADDGPADDEAVDLDAIRPDLAALRERQALVEDAARPNAVTKRRRLGMRTARENLADLFDPNTFVEYGALAVAAQRRRRSEDELMRATPADGLITGHGLVNADQVGPEAARCVGLAYDYTVLAGTQGYFNHHKTDRILALAQERRLPVVWFVEGGGGRPGDVDVEGSVTVSALTTPSFQLYAELSGLVPRIGIAAGRCFAGNAVFFGCSDVTIATRNASIGLGGPAMIEGGGLGSVAPDEVGPAPMLAANGVVDVLTDDEAEATAVAKQVLGMFQGRIDTYEAPDPRRLRARVPERRRQVYDMRQVLHGIADAGSVVELRAGYAPGMLTALARVEGWPLGFIANDPRHLGGAIDAPGADKASRFMQLCDAFDLPLCSLCDTPGFMVGPESERTAAIRRGSRMFVTAASMTVPIFTVITRRAYGLGAMAMAGGQPHASAFTVAWPTGELGAMGLEGAVRLGFRKELQAQADPAAREALFERLLSQMIERGRATSVASFLEIDAVIDPADTREWIVRGRRMAGHEPRRAGKKRPCVDPW